MQYLAIVAFFVVLIGAIVWLIKFGKKINARKRLLFVEYAQKKGLTHSSTKHFLHTLNTIDGTMNDCHFQIYEQIEGSGKHQHVVAYIKFYNSPLNFDFKISKEHLFSKAGKMFGKQDIQMGNEEFDNLFY